tara:strand:- start:127 stop:516 length:390 start_codon:yes stop_codon:yes gene_type:complete
MEKPSILKGFNDHFEEFVNDIKLIFPENVQVNAAGNMLSTIRKANPKLIIKIWKNYISDKYKEEIDKKDITFFIDKNYKQDLQNLDNSSKVLNSIETLRKPISEMGDKNQEKAMTYICNLTKLSNLYFL